MRSSLTAAESASGACSSRIASALLATVQKMERAKLESCKILLERSVNEEHVAMSRQNLTKKTENSGLY